MDRIRRSFAKTMSVISRNLLLSIDLFLYLTVIVFTIYYILNVLIILLHWRWLERFSPENVLFTSTNIPADSVTIRKIEICDLKRKKKATIMVFRKRKKFILGIYSNKNTGASTVTCVWKYKSMVWHSEFCMYVLV